MDDERGRHAGLREKVADAIAAARALPGTKPRRTSDVDRRAANAAIMIVGAEIGRLREALTLAGNRLARCALEAKPHSPESYEWADWADAAFDAREGEP